MQKVILLFLMLHSLVVLLKAGDKLDFKETLQKNSTLYELQLHSKDKIETIWSREVPFVDGEKPGDGCAMWQWEKNERGMIVVIAYDGFEGRFLQFDAGLKLLSELFLGPYWFEELGKGAKIKLEPPDKIILENNGTIIKDFTIRDGKFFDKNGKQWGKVEYIKADPGLTPEK